MRAAFPAFLRSPTRSPSAAYRLFAARSLLFALVNCNQILSASTGGLVKYSASAVRSNSIKLRPLMTSKRWLYICTCPAFSDRLQKEKVPRSHKAGW